MIKNDDNVIKKQIPYIPLAAGVPSPPFAFTFEAFESLNFFCYP